MNYFLDALKNKYAMFSGRARRAEFWQFFLFMWIGLVVLAFIGRLIHFPAIAAIFYLGVIVPYLAVLVRRMHDVDKDWWYMFIPIYNIILACTEGTRGTNAHGPDPKGGVSTAFGDSFTPPGTSSGPSTL